MKNIEHLNSDKKPYSLQRAFVLYSCTMEEKQKIEPEFLRFVQVLELLQISPVTLLKLIKQGLPHMKINRTYRFDRRRIREWMLQREISRQEEQNE